MFFFGFLCPGMSGFATVLQASIAARPRRFLSDSFYRIALLLSGVNILFSLFRPFFAFYLALSYFESAKPFSRSFATLCFQFFSDSVRLYLSGCFLLRAPPSLMPGSRYRFSACLNAGFLTKIAPNRYL